MTILLPPGLHEIRSDDKSSVISLQVNSGQEYYIRVDEEPGFWKGHGRLTLVLAEQGRPEFKMQKPVEEDRRFQRNMIEEDTEPVVEKSSKPDKQN